MKCLKCGTENDDEDVFCCVCGAKIEKQNQASPNGTDQNRLSMGDKNVIAGDVDNSVTNTTDYNISGNATFTTVNNVIDETKQVVPCSICGKNVSKESGFTCPKCGRFVCSFHFDSKKLCCTDCMEAEQEKAVETHSLSANDYEIKVRQCFSVGIITPEIRRELDSARISLGLSLSEATDIENRCLEMNHIVLQKGADLFVAKGEKSRVDVSNCTFMFNKTSFKINVDVIANRSTWKTGNLALSIWFSKNGAFTGDVSGCITMAAADLVSLDSGAVIEKVERISSILNNPPTGTYTPFFAVGEQFEDGFKIISSGNFNPINWNQR